MKKDVFISTLSIILLLLLAFTSCKKKEVPVLDTSPITDISGTSAISGGNITDDGGETVINRGVCWSKNIKPFITDNKTTDGAGAGSFSSTITNLNPATSYYIRAYATTSSGTGYGMVLSFTTLGESPAGTTQTATNITTTTASFSANVYANYLSTTVTFEYGISSSYGNSVSASQSPVTGSSGSIVSADVTGLTAGTTYHFRVRAENSLGIIHGDDMTFTTLGQIPTVSTHAASNLQTTSVTLNGLVSANYLSTTVTFEYGTSTSYGSVISAAQSPVTGNTSTAVSAAVSGFTEGMTYHYRIKAENSLGIIYGDDKTFTTLGQLPTASAQAASNIKTTSATLNGLAGANYLSTTVSFEYGTSASYGSVISADQSPVTGNTLTSVSALVSGLTGGMTYHFRIKAANSLGITYSDDLTFETVGPVTDIEGNIYSTVIIGTQIWMAENLKTTKYNDNSDIPFVTDNTAWISQSTPGYCWYNNDDATYKNTYGALYNWYAASSGKLCPTGWHVPGDDEFTTLSNFLGGSGIAGGKMKEAGTDHWSAPNTGATNESGFTALPAGQRDDSGNFIQNGLSCEWWSTTVYNNIKSWYHSTGSTVSILYRGSGTLNQRGFSIRCIKD